MNISTKIRTKRFPLEESLHDDQFCEVIINGVPTEEGIYLHYTASQVHAAESDDRSTIISEKIMLILLNLSYKYSLSDEQKSNITEQLFTSWQEFFNHK